MFALARELLVSESNRGAADRCPLGREGRDRAWVAAPRPRVEPEQLPGPTKPAACKDGPVKDRSVRCSGNRPTWGSMWPRRCSMWRCVRRASAGGWRTTRPGWSSWSRALAGAGAGPGCAGGDGRSGAGAGRRAGGGGAAGRGGQPAPGARLRPRDRPAGQDRRPRRGRPGALRGGRAATAASAARRREPGAQGAAGPQTTAGDDVGGRAQPSRRRRRCGSSADRGPHRVAGARAQRAGGRAPPDAAAESGLA